VKEMAILPKSMTGLDIQTFRNTADKLWLNKRHSLKNSKHQAMQQLWSTSSEKFVQIDSLLMESTSLSSSSSNLVKSQISEAESHFTNLEIQGTAAKSVIENITASNIRVWSEALESIPPFLYQFARKALQQQLPTKSNLARWKKTPDPTCDLCPGQKAQTNKHLLSNCSNPFILDQYLHRHNKILELITAWIDQNKSSSQSLFADIDTGSDPINEVFHDSCRPDLILTDDSSVLILELTVCHESNLVKSKSYKLNKYKNIAASLRDRWKNHTTKLFTLEISILGFISNLKPFLKAADLPNLPIDLKTKLIHKAIQGSFDIYSMRTNPKLKSCIVSNQITSEQFS
jgi:hypothetical protein